MFLEFLKQPRKVGAFCSSSKALSVAMTHNLNIQNAKCIAEIGPGLGSFTNEIIRLKDKNSTFIAIEINKNFYNILYDKFGQTPNVYIENQNANNINNIIKSKNIENLDIVISGIPWTILKPKDKITLLSNINESLKKGGVFSTFMYALPTPQAKSFRKILHKKFSKVKVSKIIWKNFPPAIIFYCKK
ncbi:MULTISPECIES: class I SAM-dependent methyltransferase [Helicobacter]|uniref:SAM-dependent methyltransferase n=1 Tax=Helicobacter ibis TaxID=2962633 RepID=A0ABT4VDA3_9HELI|nr:MULTISPECIES: rRNA adenine N-6-methyltransferase family protein [Helicobacter]MDA3967246.1 SAM-dependent methyltransferase [Helicobacter sp. WB40]MDA3968686.1 SAM-dependent methyltransferase [Helicobacter ibis]